MPNAKAPLLRPLACLALAEASLFALVLGVPFFYSLHFSDPWTGSKWAFASVVAAAGLGALILSGEIDIPKLPRLLWCLCALLAVTSVARNAFLGLGYFGDTALAALMTASISLVTFNVLSKRDGAPLRLGLGSLAGVIGFIGLALDMKFRLGADWPEAASSAMGNPNLAAQYVALAFALSAAFVAPTMARSRKLAVIVAAAGALSFVFIYLTKCRSAFLAVLVYVGALGFSHARTRNLKGVVALTLVAIVVGATALRFEGGIHKSLGQWDNFSARERLILWRNTISMIRDRPWGIGSDQFLYEYPLYRARANSPAPIGLLDKTPHNEILRLIANEGIAWFALATAAMFLLVMAAFKHARARRPFLAGIAAIFAVESMLQFPFMMAFPACAAGLALGLAFSESTRVRPRLRPASLLGAAMAIVGATALFWTENSLIAPLPTLPKNWSTFACRIHSGSAETCLLAAQEMINERRLDNAMPLLDSMVSRVPCYPPALLAWSMSKLKLDEIGEGCAGLALYDRLFEGASGARADMDQYCNDESRLPEKVDEQIRRLTAKPQPSSI